MKKICLLNSKMLVRLFYLLIIIFLLGSQCDDDNDGPSSPATTPTPDANRLLIADFNTGKDPINSGGKLQQWNHGDLLIVETGYHELESEDEEHGKYAAFVSLTEPASRGRDDWSGGGLVIVLQDDELAMDLTDYQFLEFDAKVTPGSTLATTRVKLESPDDYLPEDRVYGEKLLSDYGVLLSTEWQTVRIPLMDFAIVQDSDPDYWYAADLTSITKFVTVSVRDDQIEDTQGTLLIDNIWLIK